MFAGHLGAGLIIKRFNPTINLGIIFLAVLFLDLVLWIFVLAGLERPVIPPEFRQRHYLTFFFPYSHGLLSSLIWSGLAGLTCYGLQNFRGAEKRHSSKIIALGIFSHFVLDYLVHIPEMPLLGPTSYHMGLGLWRHLPLALGLEASIALVGTWLFMRSSYLSPWHNRWLAILMILVTSSTVAGQWLQTSRPQSAHLAISSLVGISIVGLAGFWIDRNFSL
jgi:hypothetical protein